VYEHVFISTAFNGSATSQNLALIFLRSKIACSGLRPNVFPILSNANIEAYFALNQLS